MKEKIIDYIRMGVNKAIDSCDNTTIGYFLAHSITAAIFGVVFVGKASKDIFTKAN